MTADHQPDEGELFAAFLDDFYAECDEHLASVRRALLALEPGLPSGCVDRALLDELFRSFHSLKGLAGMAGALDAERVAHALEAILRRLRQEGAPPTSATFEALMLGVRALDQLLAAQRAKAPAPEVAAVLETLEAAAAHQQPAGPLPAAGLPPDEQARLVAAQQRGDQLWRVEFTSSPELAARGVTVTTVRERLQSLGALIRVAPRVSPGGGISFEFVLAARLEEGAAAALAADGMAVSALSLPPSDPSPAPPTATPAQVVRVELERLDELLQLVGELMIARARMDAQLAQVEPLLPRLAWRELQETGQTLGRRLRDLRAGVVRTRMVPVGATFSRLRFALRDLARELGKPVTVTVRGQETEIDTYLIERLLDPLLHLARNALSHGIEEAAERIAAGKPAAGTITLHAAVSGDSIVVAVEDDGRGINADAVAARARALHLPADAATSPEALLAILCTPGFSTRAEADRVSGMGVGLDVVRTAVRELNGELALRTAPGRGTSFRMTLPLTLLVVDALLATVGGQVFAFPLSRVREVIALTPERVSVLEGHELMLHRGGALPLLRLAHRFGLAEPPAGGRYAFVVGDGDDGGGFVGLVVDRLLGKRELVVRPMPDTLGRVSGIGGAAELGDGRPVLIVDAQALLSQESLLGSRG